MVKMDDFDKKTPTSMVQYGFCCVSVECCEVTEASSGPGDQSGAVLDRVSSNFCNFTC